MTVKIELSDEELGYLRQAVEDEWPSKNFFEGNFDSEIVRVVQSIYDKLGIQASYKEEIIRQIEKALGSPVK